MATIRSKLIRGKKKWLSRAAACTSGMAATEFALMLPFLAFLFFGMLEASEALTVNRRVSKAVNTLSDLTAQLNTVSPSEFDNLIDGVTEILNPADTSGVQMSVTSVIDDGSGNPIVHWSRDRDGNEPYSAGSNFLKLDDPSVLDAGGSVIFAEITYPHDLSVSNYVLSGPITFERASVRWPRSAGVTRVQFCVTPGSCTS